MHELSFGIAAPGFRLPASTRLGVVRLQVGDLARSVDFYRDVLGLEPGEVQGATARLGPAGAGSLVELVGRPGARPVPPRGRLGLFHFAVLLPTRADLGRFLKHLARLGVRSGGGDHAVSEAVYLADPDGLGIEVYVDRPPSVWRVRDGELAMTTEALDVDVIVRSAGDTEWDGAPRGTTIGHVHLSVGDLDRAAAFYHRALGLDITAWSYPGALFMSAGGYHHHVGANVWSAGAPRAGDDDARLLEWELVLPDARSCAEAAASLEAAGHVVARDNAGVRVADPWGTPLRLATTPTARG